MVVEGLEFEAVHIPGMTIASFPSPYRGQRCPPPIGMIVGAETLTVSEEAKLAHDHEEECLFFVAMSRAHTHLRFYLSQLQPVGEKKEIHLHFLTLLPAAPSPRGFLRPPILQLPPEAFLPTSITVILPREWHVTDTQIVAYEKCPRSLLFYTHVFKLGGARKATAFSRTHDCLYELIHWLSHARLSGDQSIEADEEAFATIWKEHGPTDHAFAADYYRLASRLVGALVRAGAGRRFCKAEPIAIDLTTGRVLVEPNEVVKLSNGTVVLRRVRTGYKRSDEYDKLEYTLYHLAGQAKFGSDFLVEALHLTDETMEAVTITPKKLSGRKAKTKEMMVGIGEGRFPGEMDSITCPRCPHFFICGDAFPNGPLTIV